MARRKKSKGLLRSFLKWLDRLMTVKKVSGKDPK
jgi:hypothetical protein